MERATRGRTKAVAEILYDSDSLQGGSLGEPPGDAEVTDPESLNGSYGTAPGRSGMRLAEDACLASATAPSGRERALQQAEPAPKGHPRRKVVDRRSKEAKQAELRRCHDSNWIDEVPEAPVFRPTLEEFKDPMAYIAKIRAQAAPWGICKVVPPVSAGVPGPTVLLQKGPFRFTTRRQALKQPAPASLGQLKFHSSGKEYSIVSYEKAANEFAYRRYNMASGFPSRFVEAEYWRERNSGSNLTVEYGNDVEGTAFSGETWDPLSSSRWACDKLPVEPNSVLRMLPHAIPGVTTPMMYIGMLFSTFAWHVEDLYLYSINFHHFGAPKTWYGVPDTDADGFEEVVMNQVYNGTKESTSFSRAAYAQESVKSMAGKTTMFSPEGLLKAGVKVCRCVQNAGEFVITFPRSYHSGFSHGYNCGEAVNFGMGDWYQFGLAATIRHSLLRTPPIISVEGLLCMEAAQMGAEHEQEAQHKEDLHRVATKASFLRLMMWQNSIRERLAAMGATCCTMSADKPPVMACQKCSRFCYLAAILPDIHAEDSTVLCMQCGVALANKGEPGCARRMLVMCHSDIQASEDLAKRLHRGCVEASDLRRHWEDSKWNAMGKSSLLEEPDWWGIPAEFGCREAQIDYEWAEVDLKPMPRSAAWDCVLHSLSWTTSTTSSNSAHKPPKASKRKPAADRAVKGKVPKHRHPMFSWQRAIQTGNTGEAADEALQDQCPLALLEATSSQWSGRDEAHPASSGPGEMTLVGAASNKDIAKPSEDQLSDCGSGMAETKGFKTSPMQQVQPFFGPAETASEKSHGMVMNTRETDEAETASPVSVPPLSPALETPAPATSPQLVKWVDEAPEVHGSADATPDHHDSDAAVAATAASALREPPSMPDTPSGMQTPTRIRPIPAAADMKEMTLEEIFMDPSLASPQGHRLPPPMGAPVSVEETRASFSLDETPVCKRRQESSVSNGMQTPPVSTKLGYGCLPALSPSSAIGGDTLEATPRLFARVLLTPKDFSAGE